MCFHRSWDFTKNPWMVFMIISKNSFGKTIARCKITYFPVPTPKMTFQPKSKRTDTGNSCWSSRIPLLDKENPAIGLSVSTPFCCAWISFQRLWRLFARSAGKSCRIGYSRKSNNILKNWWREKILNNFYSFYEFRVELLNALFNIGVDLPRMVLAETFWISCLRVTTITTPAPRFIKYNPMPLMIAFAETLLAHDTGRVLLAIQAVENLFALLIENLPTNCVRFLFI